MKHRNGSIVIFALIILAFVLTAALSIAAVTLVNRRSANISVNSTVAFQNSDKGMEDFLQQLHKEAGPGATLAEVAANIKKYTGEEYTCHSGSAYGDTATIGNTNTQFIITAYTENPATQQAGQSGWGTVDIGTDTERISATNELMPIADCAAPLSMIDRFKVVGNQNNAVRAVFVKVARSSNVGLLAHWSFSDWRYMLEAHNNQPQDIYVAQDFSRNSHLLTLCRRENNDDVTVHDPFADATYKVKEFSKCEKGEDEDHFTPGELYKEGDNTGMVTDHGIVKESSADAEKRYAMQFGPNESVKNYLALWTSKDNECAERTNCLNAAEDRLSPTDGVSVAAWVKWDGTDAGHSGEQAIVSRWHNNKGYRLYVDTEEQDVCFQVDGKTACGDVETGKWHFVVGRWTPEKNAGRLSLVVNDDAKESMEVKRDDISYKSYEDNEGTFFIGADYAGGGDDDLEHFFRGTIDDVRLWNRYVEDAEVRYLCKRDQGITAPYTLPSDVRCFGD